MELLKALFAYSEEPLLIQEFCNGREFGIDVYVDLVSGEVVDIFAKEKLRMRAGETEKSVTSNDPALKEFVYRAASTLKLSGPVDMVVLKKTGYFICQRSIRDLAEASLMRMPVVWTRPLIFYRICRE